MKFRIPFRYKTSLILVILSLIWWSLSCTYDPFQPPELPKFYQTINLPLTDVSLPLGDLQDSTNGIFGDSLSDSLYFKFEGLLDTVTLTEDIFVIPTATNVAFQQDFGDMDQASNPVEITFSQKLRLATLAGISLPRADTLTVPAIPRTPLIDQEMPYQIFDKDGIPYFERVDYLTIGDGEFSTSVENETLMDLDSVVIQMKNKDGSIIAESFYETIPAGETRSSNSDLRGKQLQDSIAVSITAILAGTDEAPLVIPANTDPYMTLTVDVSINEIESFTGKPEPIETRTAQKLPESNNTIFKGILGETPTLSPDTNLISWRIENTLPVNMNMELVFYNFYDESGALTIDAILNTGEVSQGSERLDLDTLRNVDPTTIVDSILVVTTITILPDDGDTVSTIPLDFGDGMLNFSLNIAIMKFKEIVGFFNESFAIPPITISDIPSGFGDVNFGEVLLKLHLFNEIQAQTELEFNIVGYKENRAPEVISANEIIYRASDQEPVKQSNIVIDIAPIFNLVPDSMMVFGKAAIPADDTSRLQVNKSFWGSYEVIVPFVMQINDMTFIPVTSSKLAPMDAETRQRLQRGLIEAAIISEITNDFPLSGRVDILISTYDYFPLYSDSLDSGYQFINDTIFAITDTGNISVIVDTLATIVLPEPVLDQNKRVRIPGFVKQSAVIDSAKIEVIISNKTHYIRPRIHFNGTDDFVFIGYNDIIRIVSLFSMKLDAGTMFGPVESEDDSVETDSLKKPTPLNRK
ncbi:MAG: hypothetical protein Q7J65_07025 [Candidatus Marinimicrobia bacterium]|nr:hypothetical protein [Candidatus Neomarinimicrobiota bacterium]